MVSRGYELRAFSSSGFKPLEIVSDGDLDGIFAVGILLRYFDSVGISIPSRFPAPRELHNLTVEDSILVELGPTKGLRFRGHNMLIDHHEGFSGIYMFNGPDMESPIAEFDGIMSVVEIVVAYLNNEILIDSSMQELIDIVGEIDNGVYNHPKARALHHAYMLNVTSKEMRQKLPEWVRTNQVDVIWKWVEVESKRWEQVQTVSAALIDSVSEVSSDIGFILVDLDDNIQQMAAREAMLQLEEQYRIVITLLGTHNKEWMISRGGIGSKSHSVDFTSLYDLLREKGLTAGGRPTIGGFQFLEPYPLANVLVLLRNVLARVSDDRK